jgi:hypothetical protein
MQDVSVEKVIALIRLKITTDTTLRAELGNITLNQAIGGRVIPPALRDDDAKTLPCPTVIVDFAGGEANYGVVGLRRMNAAIYVYSDQGVGEAHRLYAAVCSVLHAERLVDPDGVLKVAGYGREIAGPKSNINDVMQRWVVQAGWTFTISEAA